MNTTHIRLILIIYTPFLLICSVFIHKSAGIINHNFSANRQPACWQKPKSKNTATYSKTNKQIPDSTFTLRIENEKRVVDAALKAKLTHEIKEAIAGYKLKKPYKIAMGFTKGARDVETFLFGEQIFYALAENGFVITGTPHDMPEETPNVIPQIQVKNNIIYIVLSKL